MADIRQQRRREIARNRRMGIVDDAANIQRFVPVAPTQPYVAPIVNLPVAQAPQAAAAVNRIQAQLVHQKPLFTPTTYRGLQYIGDNPYSDVTLGQSVLDIAFHLTDNIQAKTEEQIIQLLESWIPYYRAFSQRIYKGYADVPEEEYFNNSVDDGEPDNFNEIRALTALNDYMTDYSPSPEIGKFPKYILPLYTVLTRYPYLENDVRVSPLSRQYLQSVRQYLFDNAPVVLNSSEIHDDQLGKIMNSSIKNIYDSMIQTISSKVDNDLYRGTLANTKSMWDIWIQQVQIYSDYMVKNLKFQKILEAEQLLAVDDAAGGRNPASVPSTVPNFRYAMFGTLRGRTQANTSSFVMRCFDSDWARQVCSMAIWDVKKNFHGKPLLFGYNLVYGVTHAELYYDDMYQKPIRYVHGGEARTEEQTQVYNDGIALFAQLFPKELSMEKNLKYSFSLGFVDVVRNDVQTEAPVLIIHMKMRTWQNQFEKSTFEFGTKSSLGSIFYPYYGFVKRELPPPGSTTEEFVGHCRDVTNGQLATLVAAVPQLQFHCCGFFVALGHSEASNHDRTIPFAGNLNSDQQWVLLGPDHIFNKLRAIINVTHIKTFALAEGYGYDNIRLNSQQQRGRLTNFGNYQWRRDFFVLHCIAKYTLSKWFYGKRMALEKINDNRIKKYLKQDTTDFKKVMQFFGSGKGLTN